MDLTQKAIVLRHLQERGPIDCKTAAVDYGIMALHSRIAHLRNEGYEFKMTYKSGKNRFGKTTHWYEYELAR